MQQNIKCVACSLQQLYNGSNEHEREACLRNKSRKEYFREYRKNLRPIKTDVTIEEREKLEKVLQAKNLTIVGWIRKHIEEDYNNL